MAVAETATKHVVDLAADIRVNPTVRGKFFWNDQEKLYVRGVTYGTFAPDAGDGGFRREVVECDFASMRDAGINAIRTYTVPPAWLLDAAAVYGVHELVGIPWEQHLAFLENRTQVSAIEN